MIRVSVFIVLLCYPALALCQAELNGQWIAFNRAGAPNSNLQCFTPKNVAVKDGYLIITTKPENASCSSFDLPKATYNYTSGFVAMNSFNFLYGTVEFRAKFGGGQKTGAWPTVWMADVSCQASDATGTDDRCNGQEIDIAEILNSDFTHVNQRIHVNNFAYNDGCYAPTTDTSQNFHVYQLIWSPGSLVFKIDGNVTCTITKSYVPNSPMYIKADMFVSDNLGPADRPFWSRLMDRLFADKALPWKTYVDYLRVTQGTHVIFNDNFEAASTVQAAR